MTNYNMEERRPQDSSIGTREIQLTRGQVAVIDESDAELVGQYRRWQALHTPRGWYAVSRERLSDRRRVTLYMHRLIMGQSYGDGVLVDHRDGNGLNNRRANLRRANNAQNCRNRKPHSQARYKGIYQAQDDKNKWCAHISVNGCKVHLGRFNYPEEAARAYDHRAMKEFGEFAYLNFPPPDPTQDLPAQPPDAIMTQPAPDDGVIQPAPDTIIIEPYAVTYDALSRGRGRHGRAHTFTRYQVRKNGRIVESGLSRRQAAQRQRAIEHSRPANSQPTATATHPLPLPTTAVTQPSTTKGNQR